MVWLSIFDNRNYDGTGPGSYLGYGGKPFNDQRGAILSSFSSEGVIVDEVTGYTGTPDNIAQRYMDDGRDVNDFYKRHGKK